MPGARSTEYVRRLGFPEEAVLTGVFTLDAARFAEVASGSAARWTEPRFLFVGRLVPEKGTDILAEAYRLYREKAADPWPLQVIGRGPFDGGLGDTPGVTMSDFVQPDALPEIYAAAGALVLPSREDMWGVVALEACTAGLPVVVSDGCGVSEDLATPANGFTVKVGDAAGLAAALGGGRCDVGSAPGMGSQQPRHGALVRAGSVGGHAAVGHSLNGADLEWSGAVGRPRPPGRCRSRHGCRYFLALDVLRATAARKSAFSAFSLSFSPSWKSMARRTLPSRLELKRPEGSFNAAPLAKVIFTTLL